MFSKNPCTFYLARGGSVLLRSIVHTSEAQDCISIQDSFGDFTLDPALVYTLNLSQNDEERSLSAIIKKHKELLQTNGQEVKYGTYPNRMIIFPEHRIIHIPPTLGVHRGKLRQMLSESTDRKRLLTEFLWNSLSSTPHTTVIIGAPCETYLHRQLSFGRDQASSLTENKNIDNGTIVIMDRSLEKLTIAAEKLVPIFSSRVYFIRTDIMFAIQYLFLSESIDLAIIGMPVPHISASRSYLRLLTRDFFSMLYLLIKSKADSSCGMLAFTNFKPYALFGMEQLVESQLITPWIKKNAVETFPQWLPGTGEFKRPGSSNLFTIAATKRTPATSFATNLIHKYDYSRSYFPTLVTKE